MLGEFVASSKVTPNAAVELLERLSSAFSQFKRIRHERALSDDASAALQFMRTTAYSSVNAVVDGRNLVSHCCEKSATRGEMFAVLRGLVELGVQPAAFSAVTMVGHAVGYTPLLHLANGKDKNGIRPGNMGLVIQQRADIEYRHPTFGMNALLKAAACGNLIGAQTLLAFRADPHAQDDVGHNAYDLSHNCKAVQRYFRDTYRMEQNVIVDGSRRL